MVGLFGKKELSEKDLFKGVGTIFGSGSMKPKKMKLDDVFRDMKRFK